MRTGSNRQKSNPARKRATKRSLATSQLHLLKRSDLGPGRHPAQSLAIRPHQAIMLQAILGNQTVQRMIQSQQAPPSPKAQVRRQNDDQRRTSAGKQEDHAPPDLQRKDDELLDHEKELLDDLESGTANIKQNLEYIADGIKLISEHGPDKLKNTGLVEGMELAASRMLKPTKYLHGKIARLQNFVDNIQGFKKWLNTGQALAVAVRADIRDPENIEAILSALEEHAEASEPYIEMLSGWISTAGTAAAKAGAVLEIVRAYARVAKTAVRVGSKLQYKLSHKSEHWLQKNLPGEFPSDDDIDIPHPPMEWSSSREIRENREAREARRWRWQAEQFRAARRKKLAAEFDQKLFPNIWRRKRRRFYYNVVRLLRQQKSGAPTKWYYVFATVDTSIAVRDYEGPGPESHPDWDARAGMVIHPLKMGQSADDIDDEISAFRRGKYVPRWPEFDKFYAAELAKHLKTADDKAVRALGLTTGKAFFRLLGLAD